MEAGVSRGVLLAKHCKTESLGLCRIRRGDSVTNVSSNTSPLVSGVGIPRCTCGAALDPTV